jgi:secondary thiamine-phosphate synthase enzyme
MEKRSERMKTTIEKIELVSKKHFEITDITNQVNKIVEKSGVKNGIIHVYTQHTTSAIKINENELQKGKSIQEYAKSHVELSKAIEAFGK